jgi:hypothetical protein
MISLKMRNIFVAALMTAFVVAGSSSYNQIAPKASLEEQLTIPKDLSSIKRRGRS